MEPTELRESRIKLLQDHLVATSDELGRVLGGALEPVECLDRVVAALETYLLFAQEMLKTELEAEAVK